MPGPGWEGPTEKKQCKVDFTVVRARTPWNLVEVKTSARAPLSPALAHFQRQDGAAHALQIAVELPFVERNGFSECGPSIVRARTLLRQPL